MKNLLYASLVLTTVICAGCKPCDCAEATLVGVEEITLKITFDTSILPWVKDKFKITLLQGGAVTNLSGTYEETKTTIRFDVENNRDFLSVKSGQINNLKCREPHPDEFTVTPPAPAGGGPAVPLTFHCTKN